MGRTALIDSFREKKREEKILGKDAEAEEKTIVIISFSFVFQNTGHTMLYFPFPQAYKVSHRLYASNNAEKHAAQSLTL